MNWKFPHSRILIFCKAPVPGKVKTRLMPDLSADQACAVHRILAEHTLRVAIESKLAPVHLYAGLDVGHVFFDDLQSIGQFELYEQQGGDLGERMWNALSDTFDSTQQIRSAVLIGSDCPIISGHHLSVALEKLETYKAVITPMEDGGYGLIGLNSVDFRSAKVCFTGVPWGTDQVLAETVERFEREAFIPYFMNTLWDVDNPHDLQRCFTSNTQEILGHKLSKVL